jgi:ligand-binding sensor domain-containing protein/two-component sensor histidine kinase
LKFFWLILIFVSFGSLGQDINHFSFNDLYDFEVNAIFDISQGNDDKMWFGTSDGLFSFDGVKFRKYKNDNYAIAYTNLKFDSKGRVWCSNFGGQLFYVENDSLKLAVNWRNKGNFIPDYDISNIPEVLIISSGRKSEIVKYNLNDPDFSEVIYSEEGVKILSMMIDDEVLFALYRSNRKKNGLGEVTIYEKGKLPFREHVVNQYNLTIPGGKWSLFGDQNGLFVYMIRNQGRIVSLSQSEVKSVIDNINLSTYSFNGVSYVRDKIWVLSRKGISIFDKKGNNITNNAMSGTSVSTLYEDREGNIWVGSLNRGVFIIPNLSFFSTKVSQNSIAHSTVDKSGNVFIMDDQGTLYLSAPPYNSVQLLAEENFEPAPLFYDEATNRLYIGNLDTYYDLNSKSIKISPFGPLNVVSVFKSSMNIGGNTYINTCYSKSVVYKTNSDEPSLYNFNENEVGLIRPYRSHHLEQTFDKSGVYIDYIDGLFYYSKDKLPFRVNWRGKEIQASAIKNDSLNESVVWITTKSQDLLKVKDGKVEGNIKLPAIAHKIAIHQDYIFLASQEGIFRYNKRSKVIDHIDNTDGWIQGRITSLHVNDNQCIVVGNHHIQKIPVDYSTVNNYKPNIYITKVSSDDSTYHLASNYQFPPESNFITFEFRGLSIRSQKKMTYKYRLANRSEEWITTNAESPEARFLNLGAGEYVFEVKICNESNVCSDIKTVHFRVLLPYYKTWWFRSIMLGLIASVIFFFVRNWYKNKAHQEQLKSEQQRLKKEIYKSKISAIRSQMNPHFMFNALNTIQEFILTNQQEVASEYLADFADLMRMYLNQSNEDNVSLAEEEETLRLYLRLENLRFNEDLDYSINIDPTLNKDGTFIPVMLLQPYVENSIKHGLLHKKGTKRLNIEFIKTPNNHLKCTITDNGIGRKASGKINSSKSIGHKSFATGANDHRVDLINQNRDKRIQVDIIDLYEDGIGSGTKVEIYIK